MEVENATFGAGSLHISTDVIAKIAKTATLEIEGVDSVAVGTANTVRGILGASTLQKPVTVAMADGVAEITIRLVPSYGSKIHSVARKVQENVKDAIQNMTGVTVSKVNVLVVGLAQTEA